MPATSTASEAVNGIAFRSDLEGIKTEHLTGYFVDWPDPPSQKRHLDILAASHGFEIAIDEETGQVVGFINLITDGIMAAYIPLLEVLPKYQGRGVGGVLIDRLLARYQDLYMIDLCCDENVVPVYESRGFKRFICMARRNFDRQSAAAVEPQQHIRSRDITIRPPEPGCEEAVEIILRSLPEWFGIEESLAEYVEQAKTMPTLLAMEGDRAVGFLMISRHFPESAEVHCVGVLPTHHRKGIGRLMHMAAEEHLIADGARFLQVKTLSPEKGDEYYLRTLAFYQAMGFAPLEVFPTLWQPHNPCLLLVKSLS